MKMRKTKYRLCLMYDPETEKHFTDEAFRGVNGLVLPKVPECPERTQSIMRSFEEAGLLKSEEVVRLKTGRLVTKEECCLVHSKVFWQSWIDSDNITEEERDKLAKSLNTIFLNINSVSCARLAAGGVLSCVDSVMADEAWSGWAIARPPGHHADTSTSSGFCIMNNVAIAARYALTKYNINRVLILDWDVHHGNGTQEIFYQDKQVLYISVHRFENGKFYPNGPEGNFDKVGEGGGEGFNINIPWNGAAFGDPEYMLAFENIILPVAKEYNPQLILISAGFDAAKGDPSSGYQVSPGFYGYMTNQLTPIADGRIIMVLEGGYNLESTSQSALMCSHVLMGNNDLAPFVDIGIHVKESALATVKNVRGQHAKYWKSLR